MIARRIIGVIVGIIAVFVIAQIAQLLVHQFYPPPSGYNVRNMDDVKKYVATLPLTAMVVVLVGQISATIVGTFAAARIGRSRVPAYVVGAVQLAGGIASVLMIPQPLWFVVVELTGYIAATIAGAMSGSPPRMQVRGELVQ